MKKRAPWFSVGLFIPLAFALVACNGTVSTLPQVTFTITPSLQPAVAELPDYRDPSTPPRARILAALRRAGGRATDFAVNEVVMCPESESALNEFIARTGAIRVSDDGAAPAPEGIVSRLSPEERRAQCHTLRVDASAQNLLGFETAVAEMMVASEVEGVTEDFDMEISSEAGAKLLAWVAREASHGVRISPNWIGYNHDAPRILNETSEHITDSSGDFFRDAFATDRFKADITGSYSKVTQAWQWMAQRGFEGTVRVGIIDSGFAIEERTARPYQRSVGDGNSDYRVDTNPAGRGSPLQFDHSEGDSVAEGPSRMRCTGGSECPWHGLGSAQTATAWTDNEFGVSGTGGQVGIPILQMVSSDLAQWKGGINTALDWGAQVISISMGFGCDNIFCEIGIDAIDFWGPFERAQSLGVPVIASAGNDTTDVDGSQNYPCGIRDVICVGALDDGMLTPIWYSNWGATRVDIWAPTNIPVREPRGNVGSFITNDSTHGGTSAAAPFVAGVVAMMKAVNPGLNPTEIQAILQTTATEPSTDDRMTGAINALEAVRMASGPIGIDDRYEPNESPAAATRINIETTEPLLLNDLHLTARSPRDYYRFTLTDWARVTLQLAYPKGMAVPQVSLRKTDGGMPPNLVDGPRSDATGLVVTYDNAAPGEYLVSVTLASTSPVNEMLYGLNFYRNPRASAISYDAWEDNDSFSRPARIEPRGTYSPTLHRITSRPDLRDVDYFRVVLPAGNELALQFNNSDMPISLSVLEGSEWSASGIGAYTFEPGQLLTLPPTSQSYFLVWQSAGGGVGRYSFTMMPRSPAANPDLFNPPPSHGGFWNIDPGWIYLDLSVVAAAEHFLLPPNLGDIDILGRGPVVLDLFDQGGNLIESGLAAPDPQGGTSTRIHWSRAPRGQQFVLRAMRPAGLELSGNLADWPSAPFNLSTIPAGSP